MTEQEQINKMTKLIADTWLVDLDGYTIDVCEVLDEADIKGIARELYGKGCRIVPDDAVVLTKEECEHRVILDEDHFERALNYERENVRKETAKEFAEKLKEKVYTNNYCQEVILKSEIDELLKEYKE